MPTLCGEGAASRLFVSLIWCEFSFTYFTFGRQQILRPFPLKCYCLVHQPISGLVYDFQSVNIFCFLTLYIVLIFLAQAQKKRNILGIMQEEMCNN